MLRLDELTIALHKHFSSNSETSSDSTARPAHRHKAVAASTSPAYRHIGDSIVTAQREPPAHHQHIATPGDSIVTATAASTSPAYRNTQRQHSDSTAAVAKFPVHSAYELRGRRLMPTSISTAHRRIGDSTVTAPREPPEHQRIATPGDSTVTAAAAAFASFQSILRMN